MKLTTEKLFELLTLVDGIHSNRWRDVMRLVELMPDIEVLEKSWFDKYKREDPKYYPLDLSKITTWSTYDGDCIDLFYYNDNGKVICDVSIYDGENLHGNRFELRFTAKLVLPDTIIHQFEDWLLYKLEIYAERKYREHLENQKKLWITDFKSKILTESEETYI